MPGVPGADDAEFVSYERWGVDFFVEAVSRDRILGAVNTIAGQPIDFGPIGVGPGEDREGAGVRRDRRRDRRAPRRRPR